MENYCHPWLLGRQEGVHAIIYEHLWYVPAPPLHFHIPSLNSGAATFFMPVMDVILSGSSVQLVYAE